MDDLSPERFVYEVGLPATLPDCQIFSGLRDPIQVCLVCDLIFYAVLVPQKSVTMVLFNFHDNVSHNGASKINMMAKRPYY